MPNSATWRASISKLTACEMAWRFCGSDNTSQARLCPPNTKSMPELMSQARSLTVAFIFTSELIAVPNQASSVLFMANQPQEAFNDLLPTTLVIRQSTGKPEAAGSENALIRQLKALVQQL